MHHQLQVTAVDTEDPGRIATSAVTIQVERNANAPQCTEETYRTTVPEQAVCGEPVIAVNCTDADQTVRRQSFKWNHDSLNALMNPSVLLKIIVCLVPGRGALYPGGR